MFAYSFKTTDFGIVGTMSNTMKDEKSEKKPWSDKLIISENNKFKAIFDMIMLVLVAYSCFTSIF